MSLKKVTVTEILYFTETNLCHRKKIMSLKKVSVRPKCMSGSKVLQKTSFNTRNKFLSEFPSENNISVTEKKVSDKELVSRHIQKFLSEKKSFHHRSKLIGTYYTNT